MNYKIITNEAKLIEFINWLPELQKGEMYYVALFARKKYDSTGIVKSDKAQLKRFTADKSFLLTKIKQLQCEVGSYVTEGVPVPEESLALYISINPRGLEKASKALVKELVNLVTEEYKGYNPHALALSCIQSSVGTKHFMDMDFDDVTIEELKNSIDITKVNMEALQFLKTRGGIHLLVELKNIDPKFKKSWFPHLSSIKGFDANSKADLVPVPGCTQGNFTPYFHTI